jgi:hypothetical protein
MEVTWSFLVGAGVAVALALVAFLYYLYLWKSGLVHRYDVVRHELDGT